MTETKMPELKALKNLQLALKPVAARTQSFGTMTRRAQIVDELTSALYVQLDLLLDELEKGVPADEAPNDAGDDIASTLHLLAALAEKGVLGKALSADNLTGLIEMLGGVKVMGLEEAGLRKKAKAAALRADGNVDLHLSDQKKRDTLNKKLDGQ